WTCQVVALYDESDRMWCPGRERRIVVPPSLPVPVPTGVSSRTGRWMPITWSSTLLHSPGRRVRDVVVDVDSPVHAASRTNGIALASLMFAFSEQPAHQVA